MLEASQAVAEIVAGLATAGALIAAVIELRGQRVQRLDERVAEISAVSLTLDVVERPQPALNESDLVRYVYRYTAHNPGRYPITDVRVDLTFPADVQRVHYNAERDASTSKMCLTTPAIAPRGSHSWSRTLLVESRFNDEMKRTILRMSFDAPDAGRCVVRTPAAANLTRTKLRGRLPESLREGEGQRLD